VATLVKFLNKYNDFQKYDILEKSIMNWWQWLFEPQPAKVPYKSDAQIRQDHKQDWGNKHISDLLSKPITDDWSK
jgi:hypothetical protein